MGSESVVGKDPAKVRLACRKVNSFGPGPPPRTPPPGAPKQQDILTKQQNSFSILHLNYSPFPSAVSARTYNRQLLGEPRGPRALTRASDTRLWGALSWALPRDAVAAWDGDSAHSARRSSEERYGAMVTERTQAAATAPWSPQPLSNRPSHPALAEKRPAGRALRPAGEAGICPGSLRHLGSLPTGTDPTGCGRPLDRSFQSGDPACGLTYSRC